MCIRAKWLIRLELIMKWLGVFSTPPGWDANPLQGYPSALNPRYPFIHLGEESHCKSSVLAKRTTQCPDQGSNPNLLIRSSARLTSSRRASQAIMTEEKLSGLSEGPKTPQRPPSVCLKHWQFWRYLPTHPCSSLFTSLLQGAPEGRFCAEESY